MFLLYSTRGQGWATKSGGYTSDRAQAKEFGACEALDLCVLHRSANHQLLPVRVADLHYIQQVTNDKR